MGHRSNYDWMLFLTLPMTFVKPITSCSLSKHSNPYTMVAPLDRYVLFVWYLDNNIGKDSAA